MSLSEPVKSSPVTRSQSFLILGGTIAGLFIIMLLISLAMPKDKTPEAVKIKADVGASGYELLLTNKNDFDWYGVTVYLNGFDYQYSFKSILAGEQMRVNLIEFCTGGGDRFNPFLKKLLKVYLTTDSPKGAGAYEFIN